MKLKLQLDQSLADKLNFAVAIEVVAVSMAVVVVVVVCERLICVCRALVLLMSKCFNSTC